MSWQVGVETLAEFDEPEDDSQGDEAQDYVDDVEEFSCLLRRSVFCHRDSFAGVEIALFLLGKLPLEADYHGGEDQDDEFLQPDTSHIDMKAILFDFWRVLLVRHETSGCLDEKGKDVEGDEDPREVLGFDPINPATVEKEVNHATHEHVDVCIDPEWCKEDEK